MILNPLNTSDSVITIGTLPPADQVNLYELTSSELMELQQRINAYGFKDNNNDPMDEDGVFGDHSMQGLNNFLAQMAIVILV